MNFYETLLEESEGRLQQGDILHPVPFVGFSLKEAVILAPDKDQPSIIDLTQNTDLQDGAQLLAGISTSVGVVLNQSCDLSDHPGRGKPILVARVLPSEQRVKNLKPDNTVKKNVSAIKALANPGKSPSIFYLPEYKGDDFQIPKCVVDLLEATSFPPSDLTSLSSLVRLRLSQVALQAFQERLAYCFGRFGAPDHLYMNQEEQEHEIEQQANKRS